MGRARLAGCYPDAKDDLSRYLQHGRDGVLWKRDGLGEHDIRRPLTPTGTNLLGLVKHLASNESGYFGKVFERPFPEGLTRLDPDAGPDADRWATAEESRAEITDLYRRTWAHSDATIAALPLAGPGAVVVAADQIRHPAADPGPRRNGDPPPRRARRYRPSAGRRPNRAAGRPVQPAGARRRPVGVAPQPGPCCCGPVQVTAVEVSRTRLL